MLGRLARWLRALGFDTTHDDPHGPTPSHDRELVARAIAEDRVLLTRDRGLVAELRPPRVLLVISETPLEQLRQVVDACALRPGVEPFTRCLMCNTPLREATADEAASLVPAAARGLPGPVRRCPACGRTYWPGSHVRRMRDALSRALPEWEL